MTVIDPNKRTIIFDFGNVLFNLDFKACFNAFEKVLGVKLSFRTMDEALLDKFRNHERGKLNDEEFIWHLQQLKPSADPRDIIKAWNSILGDMPRSRMDMLLDLREKYNIALLSNINSIHIDWLRTYFKREHNMTDFEERFFHRVFYSHLVGMRKPDEEIYEHVTSSLEVDPSTIFFIDDLEENIKAAKAYGWDGVVHSPKEDILNNIDRYLSDALFHRDAQS